MKAIISTLALLWVSNATACKLAPSAYDLQSFLAESKNDTVVFTGRVISVSTPDDGRVQRITLKAEHWWRGHPQKTVVVAGSTGTMPGTDCEGVFDFTARVGATVLIVGEKRGLEVYPSGLLSREVKQGKLPQEVVQLR